MNVYTCIASASGHSKLVIGIRGVRQSTGLSREYNLYCMCTYMQQLSRNQSHIGGGGHQCRKWVWINDN